MATKAKGKAAKGESRYRIDWPEIDTTPLPLPKILHLAQGETVNHLWWALYTYAQRQQNAERRYADAKAIRNGSDRSAVAQRNLMHAAKYADRDNEDAGRYLAIVRSFAGVDDIKTHCIDRFGEFNETTLKRLCAGIAVNRGCAIGEVGRLETSLFAKILAGNEPIGKPTPTNGERRPAYERDHEWLRWHEAKDEPTFGRPANIRDQWNQLDDVGRKRICPTFWAKIGNGSSGTSVVNRALSTARDELGRPKKPRPGQKKS